MSSELRHCGLAVLPPFSHAQGVAGGSAHPRAPLLTLSPNRSLALARSAIRLGRSGPRQRSHVLAPCSHRRKPPPAPFLVRSALHLQVSRRGQDRLLESLWCHRRSAVTIAAAACVSRPPPALLGRASPPAFPPRRWCSRRPPLASRLPRPSFATPLPCRSIVAWLTPSQCRGRRGQPAAGYARPGRVFSWARAGTVMGA
jgi:hypothetical protein